MPQTRQIVKGQLKQVFGKAGGPVKGLIVLPNGPAAPFLPWRDHSYPNPKPQIRNNDRFMLGAILIIILVLMLIGVLPVWRHGQFLGPSPKRLRRGHRADPASCRC